MVLAHGAGGGSQSKFMVQAGKALAARGIIVATFDFPYMAQGRSVPDKGLVLETAWRAAIDEAGAHPHLRQGYGGQADLQAPVLAVTDNLFEATIDLHLAGGKTERWHIRQDSLIWSGP